MNQKQIIINIPSTPEVNQETLSKCKNITKILAISLAITLFIIGLIWTIGGYQASQSALNYANLNKGEVSRLSFEFDMEGFTPTYEVEWVNNSRKHEYTVHALNGNILKMELD